MAMPSVVGSDTMFVYILRRLLCDVIGFYAPLVGVDRGLDWTGSSSGWMGSDTGWTAAGGSGSGWTGSDLG